MDKLPRLPGVPAGFVADGEVVCGECYTRFVKPTAIDGEGLVVVFKFECWRGHAFGMRVEHKPMAETVEMDWVR